MPLLKTAWRSLLVSAVALAAHGQEIRLDNRQMQSLGIEVAAPEAQATSETAGLAAEVMVPNNQLHVVSTPLPGLVESVLVAVNEPVRRGQVLARMQSSALAEAQRGYLQAATQLQLAQASLDRDSKLAADGLIAESRLLSSRAGHVEASALLAERRHALRLSGMTDRDIDRLRGGAAISSSVTVTSPVNAVVVEQMAQAGQRLEAFTPLYKLAQLDPLWLEIQVPLARAAGVREGARVRVPAADASGRIISVGKRVTPESQTVMLRALITTNASRLKPGQYVEAAVTLAGEAPSQWRIPASALARARDRLYVFLRSAGGFTPVAVTLVNEGGQAAVVAASLPADARIAVAGVAALKARLVDAGR
ncbi:MAG: efflux RND transporter periplasmic adaptor subunit [Betaproteobacteria bacterium]